MSADPARTRRITLEAEAPLSSRLAALAEDAGDAYRRGHARSVEAAEHYLGCGHVLIEAKAECEHGLHLPFLARAAVPARTAQRLMQMAASGMEAENLARFGLRAAALASRLAEAAAVGGSLALTVDEVIRLDPILRPFRNEAVAAEVAAAARRRGKRYGSGKSCPF